MAAPAALARVCALRGHEDRVWGLAWRPGADPPQLASCGTDQVVRLWGARGGAGAELASEESWMLLTELESAGRHTRTLRSLSWDVNGTVLAVVSFDATTTLWKEAVRDSQGGEALRFECVGVASGHENEVKSAAFSPSGDFFATCSRDKSVWIYDAADNFEYECIALLQSHTQDVKMVKWHPSQDVLFSCSYDDTIKIWGPDGDDWSCKETLEAHSSTVWCLSFNAEGSHFATCSDDRTIRIWAPGAATMSQSAGETRPVGVSAAVYVSPLFRGGSLASTGAGRPPAPAAIKIERKAPADASCQWHVISTIEDQHSRPVYAVDWLPSSEGGSAIASACGDNSVRIFRPVDEASLETWTCVAAVEAHLGDVNSVTWCPTLLPSGGALLASAGDDCEVALWRWSC